MRDQYFYLEFTIGAYARFDALSRMFVALKAEKDRIWARSTPEAEEDDYEPMFDPKWLELLDEPAIEWFADTFEFDSSEGETFQRLWNLTSPEVRRTHPMFQLPGNWNFEAMLDALFNGEYVLVDIVKETPTTGVLFYEPFAAPFGGSEGLVALVESFGHTIIFDSWHKGPHQRRTSAWDYQLAKELVAAGKGVKPE